MKTAGLLNGTPDGNDADNVNGSDSEDSDDEEAEEAHNMPEEASLALPSSLSPAERQSVGQSNLIHQEIALRVAQIHEALQELRICKGNLKEPGTVDRVSDKGDPKICHC
ncbi:hypothetical protein HGRIS_003977 [Hohenbuehelia grisea]|uniref:Uncharacterized protein n=1 Tax=Hohenbuehelia grisea TaxID=104357 RepID=A0ABR3JHF6_9AGAR